MKTKKKKTHWIHLQEGWPTENWIYPNGPGASYIVGWYPKYLVHKSQVHFYVYSRKENKPLDADYVLREEAEAMCKLLNAVGDE